MARSFSVFPAKIRSTEQIKKHDKSMQDYHCHLQEAKKLCLLFLFEHIQYGPATSGTVRISRNPLKFFHEITYIST